MNEQINEKNNEITEATEATEAAETAEATEATETTEITEATETTEATEATEVAEAVEVKAAKKKINKKEVFRFFMMVLVAALVCLVVYVYMLMTPDARFLRDMARGLTASWALEDGEVELQNREAAHNVEFVGIEYDAVAKYRDKKFLDDNLKTMALDYIDALDKCKNVTETLDPNKDFDAFWKEFSKPYGERLIAVYNLYKSNYELRLDEEESSKEKDNFLAQGWILSKVGDIEFTREQTETGVVVYNAEIMNDSGFDLDFLDFEVGLYDEDGKLVETASAYAENIEKGAPVGLVFYQTSDEEVTQYRIVSEICRIKPDDSEKDAPKSDDANTDAGESGGESEKDADAASTVIKPNDAGKLYTDKQES